MRRLSGNGSIQSPFKNRPLKLKPTAKTQEAKFVKRPREGAAYKDVK